MATVSPSAAATACHASSDRDSNGSGEVTSSFVALLA